jgi:putative ABC transport system permease protein
VFEASLEHSYAKRLGVKLGDRLEVEIQGVKVIAKVTSLRSVRWTSFRPNFFVLLSRAALEDAPTTWVGSLPRRDAAVQQALQSRLMERFPNLTMIDVSRTMDRVMDMIKRLLSAIRFISLFSLAAGLAVVLGIVISGTGERAKHLVLWRLLGASNQEMSGLLAVEFACLALVASVMGLGLAALASRWLVQHWFDLTWRVAWGEIGMITGLVVAVTVVAGWLSTSDLFMKSPASLLRGDV